jgi:regulator of cell morphogenesis and NO signaling
MEITKESTVAEVVSKNLGSDHVFSKYKIDFCCGGGMSLEAACKESGVAFETIKEEIEEINIKIKGAVSLDDLDIPTLISQAKNGYHTSISDRIFEILPFAEKVAEVHGDEHKEVVKINELVKEVDVTLKESFLTSIMSLFPIVDEVVKLNEKSEEISLELLQNFQKSIQQIEGYQVKIGNTFKELSKLSSDYTTPAEACNSYKFLYERLEELQHEVHNYMHFEKNVLIPKTLKIIE